MRIIRSSILPKDFTFDPTPYVFIFPCFVVFVLFSLYPIIRAIVLAFQEYSLEGVTAFVGLRNFMEGVIKDNVFWIAMKNTLIYTILRVPVNIFVALVIATLIFPLHSKLQAFYRAAYYLPGVVSLVVISMIWRWIYNPIYGFFNYALIKLGITTENILWLTSPSWALPSIIIMAILSSPGSSILIYLAAMSYIPKSIYESTDLDGVSAFKRWLYVTIPLLHRTTLYLFVLNTIASFQVFTQVYVMTKGGPGYATTTIVPLIYFRAFRDYEFGIASAQALVLFVVIVLFAIIEFKYIRRRGEYI